MSIHRKDAKDAKMRARTRSMRSQRSFIRGARQVGKTWSVLDLGISHLEGSLHVIDLEQHPDWHRVFDGNLSAKRILSELEILINARIVPGKDLLFLDEIQSCPRAIMALRYFYEECPELHVMAAGSLLEFAMRDVSHRQECRGIVAAAPNAVESSARQWAGRFPPFSKGRTGGISIS